ncbi:hypothetical protein [Nocardiopsis sp. YSL2]|uniref:hypothetical protein n=1 Tax=Nocardiopsis sp. YSL2 TaxID=2939492 RepID=UPI0026F44AFB|nr:hypothetical protein [Nocardiopsis sp. YSL2]
MTYQTPIATPGLAAFVREVDAERQRQLATWGDQHHPDGTGPDHAVFGVRFSELAEALKGHNDYVRDASRWRGMEVPGMDLIPSPPAPRTQWAPVLLEEVAEALAESDASTLRAELIQVAAVCAAWVADIDQRGSRS